jgi:hypothetical protein
LSSLNISECFYDTDTLIGVDVLWENPHFTAPNEFNFTLLELSPAIGASVDGSDWGTESHLFGGLSDIMISEIGYAGIENANREWIRLFNPRNEDVDISGYAISDGISMVFPENTWLEAEGSLLIVQDLNFFSNTVEQIFQWDSGQLANEGERIILLNASGMVIDHVMYAPESPWPIPVLGMESLQLISPSLDNHFASSWVLANTPPMVVEDLPTSVSIALYPNPTSKTVHVVSSKAFRTLQVFNCLGKMMMSQTFLGQQKFTELDVSNYSVGTYLILIDGSESLRFIRQ